MDEDQPVPGDPTTNVLSLVQAAVKRLDDLHDAEVRHRVEVDRVRDEATRERQRFNEELRKAETARIDAIRAVDVGAVARAAEVSSATATTLAAAVVASAEALRNQVGQTAVASATALSAALDPIQKSIEDLRKAQYESAGQKSQQVESRGTNQWVIGLVISLVFVGIALIGFALSLAAKT